MQSQKNQIRKNKANQRVEGIYILTYLSLRPPNFQKGECPWRPPPPSLLDRTLRKKKKKLPTGLLMPGDIQIILFHMIKL